MNKYKNRSLWVATIALIVMIIQTFNIVELPANYNEIINAFLAVLVLLGIISNPSSGTGFKDTTEIK